MMASGWKEINNNLYYFQSWGGIYKNGFQSIGGNEYYFRSWGGVYRNTFFTVKGKTYIAQNDGSIYHASQTGWFSWEIRLTGSIRMVLFRPAG